MKTFVFRVAIAGIIVIVFMFAYASFCNFFFSSPKFLDRVSSKRSWILEKNNNAYDYAVLGSSRAYGAFQMKVLDSLLNKEGINIAANGSGLIDNFLLYYMFLEHKNKIKYLFINVDSYALASGLERTFHVYCFLPYWDNETVRNEVLASGNGKERIVWSMLPFLRYYKYNKYFSPKEVIRRYKLAMIEKSPFDVQGGGPQLKQGENSDYVNFKRSPEFPQVSDFNIKSLTRIIELSKSKGVRIIAFKAPEFLGYANKRYEGKMKEFYLNVEKMLIQYDVPYVMDFEEIEIEKSYFEDPIHLNKKGRILFTNLFHKQLLEHRYVEE